MRQKLFALEEIEIEEPIDSHEDVFLQGQKINDDLQELQSSIDVQDAITEMGQTILAKETVTVEDLASFKLVINTLLSQFNASSKIYPSLENMADPRLAVEAVFNDGDGFFKKFYAGIKNGFLALGDHFSYSFDMFGNIENRIKKTRQSLQSLPNTKVHIRVPNNIHMRFGKDELAVKSPEEYLTKLKEAESVLTETLALLSDYVEHSLFKSFEAFFRTFDEDFLFEEFDKYDKFLERVEILNKCEEVKKQMGIKFFAGDVHLGMWAVNVYRPIIDFDRRDFKKVKAAVFKTGVIFQRTSDVMSTDGYIDFNVDKKYATELIDIVEKINNEYIKFLTVGKKLSKMLNSSSIGLQLGNHVSVLAAIFTAAGRILLQQSTMLNNAVPTVFYIAKNFDNQVIMIAEKIEKELKR